MGWPILSADIIGRFHRYYRPIYRYRSYTNDDEANRNMNASDLFEKTSKMEMIGGGGKNRIRDTFFNRIEMAIDDVDFSRQHHPIFG